MTDIGWSPDGELLAATNKHNELKVWQVATGELVFHEPSLRDSAVEYSFSQLSWHPDGSLLAAALSYSSTRLRAQ